MNIGKAMMSIKVKRSEDFDVGSQRFNTIHGVALRELIAIKRRNEENALEAIQT